MLGVPQKRCEWLSSPARLPAPGGPITFYVIETFKLRAKLKLQMVGQYQMEAWSWGPDSRLI